MYITNCAELAASLGNLLFAKTLSCAISVVKTDHVQDGAATSHVRREISIAVATNMPKSIRSILAGLCKLNFCWSLFQRKLCILG